MEEKTTIEQRVNGLEAEVDILRTEIKLLKAQLTLEKAQTQINTTHHVHKPESMVWPARIRALLRCR